MAKPNRRTLSVAAVLAVAAGSLTWAATSATAATAREAAPSAPIPKCTSGQLYVWVSPDSSNGAAGTDYLHLDFTNVSGKTCYLYAYPGVSAVNANGKQLGVPASRDPSAPAKVINVVPNGTAHSILAYIDAQVGSGCPHTAATFLKVYPEAQTVARDAYFPLQVCTNNKVDLRIERVQAGA